MDNLSKLKEAIDEIDTLIEKRVIATDPEFKAWKNKAERILIKMYGLKRLKSVD